MTTTATAERIIFFVFVAAICLSRSEHFEYVKSEDLEKIGMGRPAIRRLMDAVKRRKTLKKKGLLDKVGFRNQFRETLIPPFNYNFCYCHDFEN